MCAYKGYFIIDQQMIVCNKLLNPICEIYLKCNFLLNMIFRIFT